MTLNRDRERFKFPDAFEGIFAPHRYKVFYGGRGGAKSWSVARALLILASTKKMRILCARELQVSIGDSVHRLLCDQIADMKLTPYFYITKSSIVCTVTGSVFIFKGLRHNSTEIKSLEGIDLCWAEEAQAISADSWDILIPTIRKNGSEIWITFNPLNPDDATWQRFVLSPPDDALVKKVNWDDNPWFPDELNKEREYCLRVDPDAYSYIWEGNPRIFSDAQIFRHKFVVEAFETPENCRFYHGADWGFANDPTAVVRCFIQGDKLYVDREAYGVGVELDETPRLFDSIETARKWPIKADSSRPETISYMARHGFRVTGAKKWQGSVEDGLAVLKSFEKIVIHPRCKHTADEFRLYSYKVDKNNGDILPIIVDANNHCIDALRYSLDGYIRQGRGTLNIDPKILRRGGF